MKREYVAPRIRSEKCFETSAFGCAKQSSMNPGSWHFANPYDTFTGHLGSGLGASESVTGSAGVGFGPGGTSASYNYPGLCENWVTMIS
jgi:hypothetical protein